MDRKVLDHRKGLRAPRFHMDGVAVLEPAHMQLAGGDAAPRTVCLTVDEEAARSANAFATVVVERDRIIALAHEVVVQHIEHFEKGHVLGNIVHGVVLDAALVVRAALPPDLQVQFHRNAVKE